MIPECISNLLLPVAVFVYLVCIDWRMALAMLVTVPLAFIAFAMMMKNFNKPLCRLHGVQQLCERRDCRVCGGH